MGRFLSVDPIASGGPQLMNPYSYVGNNPMRYVDPSGMCVPSVNCPGDEEANKAEADKAANDWANSRTIEIEASGCDRACQITLAAEAYAAAQAAIDHSNLVGAIEYLNWVNSNSIERTRDEAPAKHGPPGAGGYSVWDTIETLFTDTGPIIVEYHPDYVSKKIVSEATKNTGIGPENRADRINATTKQAQAASAEWLGPKQTLIKASERGYELQSENGLLRFRLQYKQGDQMWTANFERRPDTSVKWNTSGTDNYHVTVTDLLAPP